jgi:hypothetical protein
VEDEFCDHINSLPHAQKWDFNVGLIGKFSFFKKNKTWHYHK